MRPQAMPLAIKRGIIDCGICGLDCLIESGFEELEKIVELSYGKVSKKPVKIVIFGKNADLVDNENIAVCTEYPNIASKEFKRARIDFAHGSTEIMVLEGLYDYGVSVTETGNTLRRNNLNIVKVIFPSPVILLAKKSCEEIVIFGEMLKGAIEARNLQVMEMNAPKEKLSEVIKILPASESPTVSSLADGNFAVKTIVSKDDVSRLTVSLKKLGVKGIFTSNPNFLI